jgi:hypothetical protein
MIVYNSLTTGAATAANTFVEWFGGCWPAMHRVTEGACDSVDVALWTHGDLSRPAAEAGFDAGATR